ncbi:ShlB/FhaC/HecB family hemolysin secretion/activation protein [Xylophilus sp. GOD-11R]|uniref:ShlB/FhaC/HecB family hemolysin secretion/activation protein n=1 Tax=Xylophilus sp. GOD-11R TaxID=3089814 RepID=UPI00298D3493|nr:ShlB/FhaC/HecB family hemolysin secretion/activation protein [Xylophilus sp. GOD-11R]WPB58232.1 ShlB/FhaC/HecB family hemolysin secretion/activation protein [Xylophilus sp. GOD-11R]
MAPYFRQTPFFLRQIWPVILVGATFELLTPAAFAQPSDLDTRQLQRQQAREKDLRETLQPDAGRPQAAAPPSPDRLLPSDETPCWPVDRIELESAMADRFDWLVEAASGDEGHDSPIARCLGAQGIDVVLQRLQHALVARGLVTTRALVGPQALREGVLRVTVIPGVVHEVRLTDDSSPRAGLWNGLPMRPGELLRLRDVEQGLENLQRVPTAQADIRIEPTHDGASPGNSDLLVRYQQRLPLRLNLLADDGGTRATGKRQGTATISYDNWWTLNDLFYLSLGHDLGGSAGRGTRSASAHYSVPFDYWLAGVTVSRNRYFQSVAGASQTYRYGGESETAELRASRVLWRDAKRKLSASLRGFHRNSTSFIDDTEIEVQHRVTAGWEAGFSHREYVGDGVIDAALAWKRGTGAFGAQPAPEEPFGEGMSRMKVLTADLAVTKPWTSAGQRLRYSGTWRGQWNRTPLTPQDRFAIGGRYSVRGFDGESALLAERGWFWRNDLALAFAGEQQVYLGVDTGRVGGTSAQYLVGRSLTGAVLGLRGAWQAVSYDVFVGRPLARPHGFQTAATTAGFNLSVGF